MIQDRIHKRKIHTFSVTGVTYCVMEVCCCLVIDTDVIVALGTLIGCWFSTRMDDTELAGICACIFMYIPMDICMSMYPCGNMYVKRYVYDIYYAFLKETDVKLSLGILISCCDWRKINESKLADTRVCAHVCMDTYMRKYMNTKHARIHLRGMDITHIHK
jgi:hypothetical protein